MRKFFGAGILLPLLLLTIHSGAQDFSNKGKDFWVGYGYHERMLSGGGGSQTMVLYFATEAATTVTVNIPGTGYNQVYNIPANTIFTSNPLPKTGGQDARLNTEGISSRGIHITSDKPIVAYAHIYNQSVSGATLLFPTNTLGKEYYSINYEQLSNSANANCWFYAIAVDPGITTVEITPSAQTLGHPAGVPFTVDLTQGQVINIMGALGGMEGDLFRGVDLTGSRIRTISNGAEGCKRIAVFSGSGRISLVCDGVGSGQKSSDNYMVQAFPKTAWGKSYLTVPTEILEKNVFRVAVDDPATVVMYNDIQLTNLINNFYYEIGPTDKPGRIEADKPIMVAQYISTSRFCGNGRNNELGDPEVIYLSPVEQTINRVILNSTNNFSITNNYINVTIPNRGTAISSFRLDGATQTGFEVHPQNPNYSFARFRVSPGPHTVVSDSGFNAIAYGYGQFESYGYNAGANVKDLYQFVTVNNAYATVDFPAACKGAPFQLAMTFPYQPTEIQWQFNGLFPDVSISNPVFTSSSVVNGRTLYKYSLPGSFSHNTAGTYPIKVIAQNPTADGCNGLQEIEYDLEIFDLPVADFNFSTNGCVSSPVSFQDVPTPGGRTVSQYYWNFGDGSNGPNQPTTTHTYNGPGTFDVRYSILTDVGCRSVEVVKPVTLFDPPVARFTTGAPSCAGKLIEFTDASTAPLNTIIGKWTWNFGDGSAPVVASNNAAQSHSFPNPGTYTVSLQVESTTGCLSTLFTQQVTVSPNPVPEFALPDVCLPTGTANFASTSTISDGTESQFQFTWNFGDGSPVATTANPVHIYTSTGPFNVQLVVRSNAGCETSLTKTISTIFEEPQAAFTSLSEVCLGTPLQLNDQSTAPGSSVTQWEWSFGDGSTSTEKNPVKSYTTAGVYTITLNVVSAKGCRTVVKSATKTVTVYALPVADFTSTLPGCAGGVITFTNNSVPNGGVIDQWTWNFGSNPEVTTNGNDMLHQFDQAGNYGVSLSVRTDKGCISSVTQKNITVHPRPDAQFTVPEICVNDSQAPFTENSGVSAGSITQWQWDFGDMSATPGNPNNSTLQNPTHHYTLPGQYTATLIATSAAGCRDTVDQQVKVNGAVLTPAFSINGGNSTCSNNEVVIRDASQVDAGRITRVEIFWDESDPGQVTVDNDPETGKQYAHRYTEFGSPASKQVTIRYDVYSGITCVNSVREVITLLATPVISVDAALPVCSNADPFQLNSILQFQMPGSGSFSGTGVSSTGLFSPTVAGAGLHTILYTFNADNGCSNTTTRTVQVEPTPIADAGPDKVVLEGGRVQLTPTPVRTIPVTYTWTPAEWLSNPAIQNPESSPPADIIYTLKVTSDRGCSTEDQVMVKLLKNPVIPNIFSPNNDGIHDRWVIEYLESYPGCVVQLYNRYGQMVHKIVNYTTPWDGKIGGKDAPVGTYYYIIDPKNGRKPMTGYVDIIR